MGRKTAFWRHVKAGRPPIGSGCCGLRDRVGPSRVLLRNPAHPWRVWRSLVSTETVPKGYKRTEVGVIPEEWEVKPLGQIMTLQRGFDLPHRLRKSGNIPIVTSSGIEELHSESKVKAPGIVTGRYGTIGLVFYVDTDFWPLNTTLYVRDFHDNDVLYASYLLRTIDFHTHSGKSGVPGVNRNDLHEIILTIPPFAEQQAIAAALSDADTLIESMEQLIDKKRQIKQGTMQELLTGKRRLPGFTGKWETKRLGDYTKFQVGFPFGSMFFNQDGIGIRLVKNRDLKSDDQVYHYSGSYSSEYIVDDGDLLIGMDGDFAPCLWSKGRSLLNQRVGRVCAKGSIDIGFTFYYLIDHLKEIESITSSTTVKHLSHGDIEDIRQPLPPLPEQTAIAAALSDMDVELEALEGKLDKARQVKQGMMQQLLTGKVRLV
jgi:type I restriction enzyme S subunit